MKVNFKKLSKKTLSCILALAVILCSITVVFSAFANGDAAEEPYTVSYRSPAIPMFAGKVVDLADLEVDFSAAEDDTVNGAAITWAVAEGESAIVLGKSIYAAKTGITKLTATYGELTQNVYVIANKEGDTDFAIANETGLNDTSKFDASKWLVAYGEGTGPSEVNLYYSAEELTGLKLSNIYGGDTRLFFYRNDMLNDFADYTVALSMKISGENGTKPFRGVILRAQLNPALFDTDGSVKAEAAGEFNKGNLVTAGAMGVIKPGTSAMYLTSYNFGGLNVRGYYAKVTNEAYPFENNTNRIHWMTVENKEDIKIVNRNPNYVLSTYSDAEITAATGFRDVVYKVDGNDIFYSIDGNKILDTKEAVIDTMDINTGYDNVLGADWNVEGKMPEGGDFNHPFVDLEAKTHEEVNEYVENFGLGKGTIGITAATRTGLEVASLKVTINTTEMPNLKDPSFYTVKSASPAVPMFVGKVVDFSNMVVEIDGKIVPASSITWENVSGGNVLVVDGGFYANATGIAKFNAKYNGKTQTVYVMVNEPGDYDFYIVKQDYYEDYTSFNEADWIYSSYSGAPQDANTNRVVGNKPAQAWGFFYPRVNNRYLEFYTGNSLGIMIYKSEILKDFSDYTFAVRATNNTDYASASSRGFILRADVNYDAAVGEEMFNTTALYLGQKRYGAVYAGALGKALFHGYTTIHGMPDSTFHSLSGDDYLKFVNILDSNYSEGSGAAKTAGAYPGDRNYVMALMEEGYANTKVVSVKLSGSDVVYKIDDNVLLDTTKPVSVLTGFDKNNTAVNEEFDWDTAFAEKGTLGKGTIGFHTRQGMTHIYDFSVKLNDVSADTMPDMKDPTFYTVDGASPAIPMYVGKVVDFSGLVVEIDGQLVAADDASWSVESGKAIIVNGGVYAKDEGISKLVATYGGKTQNVYVVANAEGDDTFYLVDENLKTATLPANTWYFAEKNFGGYYANDWTGGPVTDIRTSSSATDGYVMGNGWVEQNSGLFYKSDVLADFADYTVQFSARYRHDSENILGSFLNVVLRADLSDNIAVGTDMLKSGSTALSLGIRPIGGLSLYGFGSSKNPAIDMTLHNVTDSALIKQNSSDPRYLFGVIDAIGAASNKNVFQKVSIKLEGNDILYKLNDREILDTTKDIKTFSFNTGGGNLTATTAITEGTMDKATYNGYMDGYNLGKGTVGFAWVRSYYYLEYLKVALNNDENSMPAMIDGNIYVADAKNPVIPMTAGTRLATSSFLVDLGNGAATGDALTWEAIDNANIKVTNDYITAYERGVYEVTVSKDTANIKLYVVVKNPEETEYVVYDKDFRDRDADVSDWKTTIVAGTNTEYNSTNFTGAKEYSGNYIDKNTYTGVTLTPNGFAPYNAKEVGEILSATDTTAYTTLDNALVKALTNYKVTAEIKAFPNYRGAVGFLGRVTTDANGKFSIGSATQVGFGLSAASNYRVGSLYPNDAFTVNGNTKAAVTNADVKQYLYTSVEGRTFQHRVFDIEFNGATATYTTPAGATETITGLTATNGTVALVGYTRDIAGQYYAAIPILASVKITLTNVNEDALSAEIIDHAPKAIPEKEIYKDLGNYTFAETHYETLPYLSFYSVNAGEEFASQKVTLPTHNSSGEAFKGGAVNVFYTNKTSVGQIVIPEGYEQLDQNFGRDNPYLEFVNIPDSMEEIGQNAFLGTGIFELVIPSDAAFKTISYSAFAGCRSLTKIDLGNTVQGIYTSAFHGCKSLLEVEIPESVTQIDSLAFAECISLKDAYIYTASARIQDAAFPTTTTIHGYIGSTAHAYALRNGNAFVALDELTVNSKMAIADAEGFTFNSAANEYGVVTGDVVAGFKEGTVTVSGSYSYVAAEGEEATVVPFSMDIPVGAFDKNNANNFVNTDKVTFAPAAEAGVFTLSIADDVNVKHDEFKINGAPAYLDEADETGKAYIFNSSVYPFAELDITAAFEETDTYLASIYALGATVPTNPDDIAIRFVKRIPAIADMAFRSNIKVGGKTVTPVAVGSMVIPTVLVNGVEDIKLSAEDIETIANGGDVAEVAAGEYNASNVVISVLNDTTADYSDYIVKLAGIQMTDVEITCVSYMIYEKADGSYGVLYDGEIARSYSAINAALR